MNHVPFSWPQLIVVAIGFVVPFLTHLVTTRGLSDELRKGLTFGITALGAAVTQASFHVGETWKAYLLAIFYAWAAMLVAHFTGIPDKINQKTPNFGIGPKLASHRPKEVHAGVEITESGGPPKKPASPGKATKARQSKMRSPRNL